MAIVEQAPKGTGLTFMDFLDAGRVFELGTNETLIIDYLKSCLRETIVGGNVLIGFEKSDVKGSQISRDTLNCSGRGMKLTPGQAQESGVVVFREADKYGAIAITYGTQPVFAPLASGHLIIDRVDAFETPRDVESSGTRLDLKDLGVTLTAGAIYRLRGSGADFIFAVAPQAKAGEVPLISRLIRP